MAPIVNLMDNRPDITVTFTGTANVVKTGYRQGYAILYSSGNLIFDSYASLVEVSMFGGGGGGGGYATSDRGGSGGGGGGYHFCRKIKNGIGPDGSAFSVAAGTYPVVIGAGGQGGQTGAQNGQAGGASTLFGFTANGGGGGPKSVYGAPCYGGNGGSGGGGGQYYTNTGLGGSNGANGQNGINNTWTNPGGTGAGRIMYAFGESGWTGDANHRLYGSGGCGGAHPDKTSWLSTNAPWGSGTQGRHATANSGCGGGGLWNTNPATNGGSGIIFVRWYD